MRGAGGEVDPLTESAAAHLVSEASVCTNWAYIDYEDVPVPAWAEAVTATLHGSVEPTYGAFTFSIGDVLVSTLFIDRDTVTSTLENLKLCIPAAYIGGTAAEIRIRVHASGGNCANFPSEEVWIDDLYFVADGSGCEGEVGGGV